MFNYPKIDLNAIDLTADERELADRILATRGVNKGKLRASKPKIKYHTGYRTTTLSSGREITTKTRTPEEVTGKAAYLWRMVAFEVSPDRRHSCMPVMAFCDLPDRESREERCELENELNALAAKICDTIHPADRHGLKRWASAFGV